MLIKNFKTFNWSGDAATMYQLGFQDPAIKLNINKNYLSTSIIGDKKNIKSSLSLVNLLNNSSIARRSSESAILFEMATLFDDAIKKNFVMDASIRQNLSLENYLKKYFNEGLSLIKKRSDYSLYHLCKHYDLIIKIIKSEQKKNSALESNIIVNDIKVQHTISSSLIDDYLDKSYIRNPSLEYKIFLKIVTLIEEGLLKPEQDPYKKYDITINFIQNLARIQISPYPLFDAAVFLDYIILKIDSGR